MQVRRTADAGAQALALRRLEAAQPGHVAAAAWFDWERLRLDLLEARGQDRQLLERVRGYGPEVVARPEASALMLPAAGAALRSGDAVAARRWLQRLFAHAAVGAAADDAAQYRRARLLAIEVSLADRDADAAYRGMLRYQQDFGPLNPEEVEGFVAGLLRLNKNSEAAQWLSQLGSRSHHAALLRLRAGLITAEAAAAQARAALLKSDDRSAIDLLEAAARVRSDRALLIEAAERRLDLLAAPLGNVSPEPEQTSAASLWRLYEEAALQGANEAQLLVGDDAGWLAHAKRIRPHQLSISRALLAYLGTRARDAALRADAQAQFVAALKEAGMARAALALFADSARFPMQSLAPRVRHLLGELAVESKALDRAASYWRGLDAPPGLTIEQWQVRRLGVAVEAGLQSDARVLASELLDGGRPLTTEGRKRMLEIGRNAVERGQFESAEELLSRLQVRANGPERAAVLIARAQGHEASGRLHDAAAAYLDAALASPSPASDRDALQARDAAARLLIRIGMREDARGIYGWMSRHAKDPTWRDASLRALATLASPVSSLRSR